jgi:hypothetical protein
MDEHQNESHVVDDDAAQDKVALQHDIHAVTSLRKYHYALYAVSVVAILVLKGWLALLVYHSFALVTHLVELGARRDRKVLWGVIAVVTIIVVGLVVVADDDVGSLISSLVVLLALLGAVAMWIGIGAVIKRKNGVRLPMRTAAWFMTIMAVLLIGEYALTSMTRDRFVDPNGLPGSSTTQHGAESQWSGDPVVITSGIGLYTIRYDESVWRYLYVGEQTDAAILLQHRATNVFVKIIAEEAVVDMKTVQKLVMENVRAVSPDADFSDPRFDRHHSYDVLYLDHAATYEAGRMAVVSGRYYAGPLGTLQVTAFVPNDDQAQAGEDLEMLLQGLEIHETPRTITERHAAILGMWRDPVTAKQYHITPSSIAYIESDSVYAMALYGVEWATDSSLVLRAVDYNATTYIEMMKTADDRMLMTSRNAQAVQSQLLQKVGGSRRRS